MHLLVLLGTALLSTVLHWGLGWEATVLAGIVGGLWSGRGHWLVGASGVGLGWAGAVLYTGAVTPAAFRTLLDTLGTLGGNIPGEVLVGLTVFLGSVLGAFGGAIGGQIRRLLEERRSAEA